MVTYKENGVSGLAERVRSEIEKATIKTEADQPLHELIAQAGHLLYGAETGGRNQVKFATTKT